MSSAKRQNMMSSPNRYKAAEAASDFAEYKQIILDCNIVDPVSGTKNWTDVRQFNLMFSTQFGSTGGSGHYLSASRNRTRHFVDYINVQKTGRMKIPFGIAQIGKGFPQRGGSSAVVFRMRNSSRWRCNSSASRYRNDGLNSGRQSASNGTKT